MDSNPEEDIFDTLDFVLYIGKKKRRKCMFANFSISRMNKLFEGCSQIHADSAMEKYGGVPPRFYKATVQKSPKTIQLFMYISTECE